MGRWEPNARGRLERAAMELYVDRGFEQTTVADIAERAGLTERTFFRHFADKREVLFSGSTSLQQLFVDRTLAAPPSAAALDAVASALASVGDELQPNLVYARARFGVITANSVLQERELIKLAALGAAVAGALRERGVAEPTASLAAEAGIAVFKVGFEQWVRGDGETTLTALLGDAMRRLRAVASGG